MAEKSFISGLLEDVGYRLLASPIVTLTERDPTHTIVTLRNARRGPVWRRTHPERDTTEMYLDHKRRVIVMHPLRIDKLALHYGDKFSAKASRERTS